MTIIKIFVESGKKKVFTGAIDWPGWSRGGRHENSALQALFDYAPRYAQVLKSQEIDFRPPAEITDFSVVERHVGNVTTDFGAPAIELDADQAPLDQAEFERFRKILEGCWESFDFAMEAATGKELRKGPRGGGRDLEKIIEHVIDADRSYLSRLAWKYERDASLTQAEELSRSREAILNALEVAVTEGLPERGPRGGIIWPPRYFIRRVAWHVLDHAWEIEDRIL
jgi:hypothetical protein